MWCVLEVDATPGKYIVRTERVEGRHENPAVEGADVIVSHPRTVFSFRFDRNMDIISLALLRG